jgi:hypothetical protein
MLFFVLNAARILHHRPINFATLVKALLMVQTEMLSQAKPMSEVFDPSGFSKPANANDLGTRLRKNLTYFKTNYAIATTGTTALVMLLNPWSLIILAILAAVWFYFYIIKTSPLVLGGREFSDREKFLLLSGTSLFTIFFLTSVGATIFYALGLSMIMVAIHASLRIPDDATLFADEVPGEGTSLTSLLSMFKPRNSLATYAAAAV